MDFLVFHSLNCELPSDFGGKLVWAYNTEEYPVIVDHILRNWKNRIETFAIEDSEFINWEMLSENYPAVYFQKRLLKKITNQPIEKRKFWLYPQSDTLSHSLSIVAENLHEASYQFILPKLKVQNADTFLSLKNIPFQSFSLPYFLQSKPDAVILLCDWSKEAQWVISLCRFFGVKTICIQESIIDFGDHFKRMQHADYVIIQGARTVSELDRQLYFVTGNPRYEKIGTVNSTRKNTCVINCNFTYNIFEEIRFQWLDEIVSALAEFNIPYMISQHPRDNGDLSRYINFSKSSSKSVHETLSIAKFVVTRFSSLIHEALIMKIPVIYYNPHNEEMKYDFEFNTEFLFLARNADELRNAISKIEKGVNGELIDVYLSNHCLLRKALPSAQIAEVISKFPFQPKRPTMNDFIRLFLYHPFVLKFAFKILGRKF